MLISIAVMAFAMIAFSRSPLYGTALPIIVVLSAGMMDVLLGHKRLDSKRGPE